MTTFDLVIRSAHLELESDDLVDIGISGGRISEIATHIDSKAKKEIDAYGRLVTPTFVEPHIHLDKSLTDNWKWFPSGDYSENLRQFDEIKRNYTVEDIRRRSSIVVRWAVQNGCTIIRSHVDIDRVAHLTPLKAILQTKKESENIADIQIVAFPQEGLIKDDEAEQLLRKAMAMGANVVGGIPSYEDGEVNARRHIDKVFAIAREFNADIDMHIDPDCDARHRTLEYLAQKTLKEDYKGRVTADHAIALSFYDDAYAGEVIRLVKQAELNVVVCPPTNLLSGALTRVNELLRAGVNIACGQDNVLDIFNPFGNLDQLETAHMAAYAAKLLDKQGFTTLTRMITTNGAKALRIPEYGTRRGDVASVNIIDAPTFREAIRKRADRLYVVRKGNIVAENRTTQILRS
jgi:cytosine deaminase